MGYWLFYAGPENYLCERGERDFANEEGPWSGAVGVRAGDVAVLYRKRLKNYLKPSLLLKSCLNPKIYIRYN